MSATIQATTQVAINLNQTVRVKVTPHGERILDEYYAQFPKEWTDELRQRWRESDADGCISAQLWHVMEIFGAHMHIGMNTPIETTIYVERYT